MNELFSLSRGDSALLINVPHAGVYVPGAVAADLSEAAGSLADTDWFVDRLYDFARAAGAGMMIATHSRVVVDLNRPSDDQSLYASRTTGLVPLETFSGEPLYQPGHQPGPQETEGRVQRYWRPYHKVLQSELERIRAAHSHVVLLDAHSIRSRLPLLFEGKLPDLNLGSFQGVSAAAGLVSAAMEVLQSDSRWSSVLDGRFQGGFITRNYGQPATGIHALQLEMAQSVYMQENPPAWDEKSAAAVRSLLMRLVQTLIEWSPGRDS